MTKYDIITLGDCSEDIFVKPHDSLIENSRRFTSGRSVSFELGEKINLENVSFDIGGSACNTAVAFSRLGYSTAIITPLGFDSVADRIINRLSEENVEIKYIDQKKEMQSNFSVIFNFETERTIFVYHGLKDYGLLKIPKGLNSKWLYLSPVGHGEDELFKKIVPLASEKNIQIAWNPGARQIEKGSHHYSSLLRVASILSLNKEEAIKFIAFPVRPEVKEICKSLHRLGPKIVLVTDGKNGAWCSFDGNLRQIDILPTKRLDATGAGDSFTAAFVSRFIQAEIDNETVETALKYAIVESTSVISKIGAQNGLLTQSQIEKELRKYPRLRAEII